MPLFSRKKSRDSTPRRRQFQAGDTRRQAAVPRSNSLFKRNRTLTGSLSSQVSSVSEQQADLKSARTHAHDLTKQRRKISSVLGIVLGICLVFAAALYEFSAIPAVTSADSAVSLQQDRYKRAIDDYLTRHPVERFRFILDKTRLNDFVRHQLPEVVAVDPQGNAGFGKSTFSFTVRKPIVSWLIGSTQYYVDTNGVPFQVNYYETPQVRIVDQSGVQQSAGTAIASSRFLNFVGRAVSSANSYQLIVEQAIIPAGTTRQVELKLKDRDYPVKLSLDRPVGEQAEDMKRAVSYLDTKNIKPQYIDVRVSGKAFYK